jgi:hypothetical protein
MANENTEKQKPTAKTPSAASTEKPQSATTATTSAEERKNRGGSKSNKTRIGGTAVPGAKSVQPKPASTSSNPQQQQAENYNRTMRRRMDNMGMAASDNRAQSLQDQRKKRITRKKQRLEERRQEIRKTMPSGGIKLGRKILIPVIGSVAFIILVIVLFLLLRH